MYHGLDNRYLYVAYQLTCSFVNATGKHVTCTGTGFFVRTNNDNKVLVTNRHVLDLEYADAKYAGFRLRNLRVSGKTNDPSSGLPEIDRECTVLGGTLEYSKVPQNDIACLIDPSVTTLDGSRMDIDYWISQYLYQLRVTPPYSR